MKASRNAAHPVELHRVETGAWREILWSNGHRIRFNTFAHYDAKPLGPAERTVRRRRKRLRKRERRANGRRLKQQLADHGLTAATIRFSW
jgi:hypothetical protein